MEWRNKLGPDLIMATSFDEEGPILSDADLIILQGKMKNMVLRDVEGIVRAIRNLSNNQVSSDETVSTSVMMGIYLAITDCPRAEALKLARQFLTYSLVDALFDLLHSNYRVLETVSTGGLLHHVLILRPRS